MIMTLVMGLAVDGQTAYHDIESHKVGHLYYHILTDSTVEVLANQDLCDRYPNNVVVPATVGIDGQQYRVVRIGDAAFSGSCGLFTSVTLPETIEEIGKESLEGLQSPIVLPEALRRIEWAAFAMVQTDTFRIPRNVEFIAEDAFSGDKIGVFVVDSGNSHYVVVDELALCSIDTTLLLAYPGRWPALEYTVPSAVRRIAGSAFYGNNILRQVTLPEGLREIGTAAFGMGLRGLHIPASVCRIDGALRDTASSRFALTIAPASRHYRLEDGMLLSYDGDTLLMAIGAEGVVQVPSGVRVIGENAFYLIDNMTRVVLPEGLREIKTMAFGYVTAEVNFPSTLQAIGDYAFASTTKIRNISIPSVRSIGKYAFLYSSVQKVENAASLQTIGDYAFIASGLRSMHFGDSLRLIGENAFNGSKLKGNITFRSHLQGIGTAAFAVGDLKKVTFRNRVDTIGHHALRCKQVHLCDSRIPKTYGVPIYNSDTVFTPCEMAEEFERAIEHEEGTVFAEWCGEVAVQVPETAVGLKVYPNPSHGDVTLTGLPKGAEVMMVCDMAGRVVLREVLARGTESYTFNVADYPAGTYFVTLSTPEGTSTQRLVVE